MLNVMIDLETLGTSPDAPVLSIGAVYFDPATGRMGKEFHVKLNFVEGCRGRQIDPSTVEWWMGQSDEARSALTSGGSYDQYEALTSFGMFLKEDVRVWGNGATFDISMLENLYRQLGRTIPWKYYNVRDVRTVVAMAKGILNRDDFTFKGIKHDALADAIHQAKYVSAMWMILRKK